VTASAKLTARISFLQVRRGSKWQSAQRLVLGPFHPRRMRLPLANGSHVVRLYVAPENAPRGGALWSASRIVRVH
jgi:hypothetical protein